MNRSDLAGLAKPLRRFKPYPAYKDSGVEWLGEIPAHWTIARISELTILLNGYPFDSEFFTRGEGTPLVRIRDLNADETEVNYVGPIVENAWIQSGDVIIGMDGDFNVARWRGQRALLNQRMCCLRPRGRTDSGFIAYLLPLPLQVINDLTYSTTVKHLSSGDVRKVRLGAPPEPEQHAIAAFLDRETARIDALVAKKERLIELLQEQRTALITRAVTKGLDPNVPMKDSGIEWLGEIPAYWEVKPVGTLAHSLVGFPFPSEEFSFGEGTRLVRGDNVTTEAVRWGDKTRAWLGQAPHPRYYLKAEDIVIGMDGSKVGRNYAIVREEHLPLLLVQRVTRLRACAKVKPGFLFWSIAGPRFHAHVDTHKSDPAIPHITLKDIETYPIAVPPTDEQLAILNWITVAGGRIHALERRVRDAIDRLTELRTALISAAVTGKIDVREEIA